MTTEKSLIAWCYVVIRVSNLHRCTVTQKCTNVRRSGEMNVVDSRFQVLLDKSDRSWMWLMLQLALHCQWPCINQKVTRNVTTHKNMSINVRQLKQQCCCNAHLICCAVQWLAWQHRWQVFSDASICEYESQKVNSWLQTSTVEEHMCMTHVHAVSVIIISKKVSQICNTICPPSPPTAVNRWRLAIKMKNRVQSFLVIRQYRRLWKW